MVEGVLRDVGHAQVGVLPHHAVLREQQSRLECCMRWSRLVPSELTCTRSPRGARRVQAALAGIVKCGARQDVCRMVA